MYQSFNHNLKMLFLKAITLLLPLLNICFGSDGLYFEIDENLAQFDEQFGQIVQIDQMLTWNYLTNITKFNEQQIEKFKKNTFSWKNNWKVWAQINYRKIKCSSVDLELDETKIKRCQYLRKIKSSIIFENESKYNSFNNLMSTLSREYAMLSIELDGEVISGENEVSKRLRETDDLNKIKLIWNKWHENSYEIMPSFVKMLNLLNETALFNDHTNLWNAWISDLDMKEPLGIAHKLWAEINVFYKHLHAYIRRILQNKYGTNFIGINGSIPIHFFKSLWADQWNSLINIALPYQENQKNEIPYKKSDKILSEAQRVYLDLGFEKLPKVFWKNSIFKNNYSSSTIMDCHPLSFDFMNGIDFRVKMCLSESSNDFDSELRKVVHEFGHIYYFKSYANQKNLFKSGPNSAFHEAIGDLMVLINNACEWKYNEVDNRVIINTLMKEALNNFVIIPWALSLEQWRHDLFSGKVSILSANEHFWNIRRKVEGIVAPDGKRLKRSFDAVCKYHVANFMPYLRYFFSRFLSHQFHKALCTHSSDPLYLCCPKPIKSSFREMLSSGSSLPWDKTLNLLTNQTFISSEYLLEYYKPLIKWLEVYNSENQNEIGWKSD